jgi:hypothetical protein
MTMTSSSLARVTWTLGLKIKSALKSYLINVAMAAPRSNLPRPTEDFKETSHLHTWPLVTTESGTRANIKRKSGKLSRKPRPPHVSILVTGMKYTSKLNGTYKSVINGTYVTAIMMTYPTVINGTYLTVIMMTYPTVINGTYLTVIVMYYPKMINGTYVTVSK